MTTLAGVIESVSDDSKAKFEADANAEEIEAEEAEVEEEMSSHRLRLLKAQILDESLVGKTCLTSIHSVDVCGLEGGGEDIDVGLPDELLSVVDPLGDHHNSTNISTLREMDSALENLRLWRAGNKSSSVVDKILSMSPRPGGEDKWDEDEGEEEGESPRGPDTDDLSGEWASDKTARGAAKAATGDDDNDCDGGASLRGTHRPDLVLTFTATMTAHAAASSAAASAVASSSSSSGMEQESGSMLSLRAGGDSDALDALGSLSALESLELSEDSDAARLSDLNWRHAMQKLLMEEGVQCEGNNSSSSLSSSSSSSLFAAAPSSSSSSSSSSSAAAAAALSVSPLLWGMTVPEVMMASSHNQQLRGAYSAASSGASTSKVC